MFGHLGMGLSLHLVLGWRAWLWAVCTSHLCLSRESPDPDVSAESPASRRVQSVCMVARVPMTTLQAPWQCFLSHVWNVQKTIRSS